MATRRLLTAVALVGAVTMALVACSATVRNPVKSFGSYAAIDMLAPTSVVDKALGTTMVFTVVPTTSVQTRAGTVPAGACGAAITAFANAKSLDNAYEQMQNTAGDTVQFNAVRYASLAVAKAAMAGWQSTAELCPRTAGSGISEYTTGVDGVSSWLSSGHHSAAFRRGDAIFYLNTTFSGHDTARVVQAELDWVQALGTAG